MNTRLYRLGVDVGGGHRNFPPSTPSMPYCRHPGWEFGDINLISEGTNTDSVLIDITNANDVKTRGVVASFKHTTTPDVTTGIEIAVQRVLEKAGLSLEQRTRDIWSLTIGTTHFINAVVQSDATKLSKVAVIRLAAPYTEDNGGLVNDIDEDELIREAIVIRQKGIKSIVIVGIYSPLDMTGQQEYRARTILLQELGKSVNIICSRDGITIQNFFH
ncbi:hypothetical protein AN958_02335 [Leucoagaricus sp. SymC.cos]|nr:hypothetical protein AN958_02335 [Leucoagaricus sp. SymC.cos]